MFLIAACALFHWAQGRKGLKKGVFGALTLCHACLASGEMAYANRPLNWGTRNRSICIRHRTCTHGDALRVVSSNSFRKLAVARYVGRCTDGPTLADRFLVLQYEGGQCRPIRAYKTTILRGCQLALRSDPICLAVQFVERADIRLGRRDNDVRVSPDTVDHAARVLQAYRHFPLALC
jgi:hypothetical protein